MNEFLFVSVQYLAYIYHFVKEWRKNPKCSLSCCLALLLPLNQLQGEIRGLTETNILKQQLQTGRIEMPTIASTLRESGAVAVTLEDHTEQEQEEATTDEKTIEHGVSTIAKVTASTLREIGAVVVTLEDHTEQEQEEATTDEKTIEHGVSTIAKVTASTLRESGVTLKDHSAEREQEEATTDEKTIEHGVQTIVKVVIHEPPRATYDTKL